MQLTSGSDAAPLQMSHCSFKIIAHAWRRQATITRGAGTEASGAWEPTGQLIVWRLGSVTPTCATVKAT